MSQDNLNKKFEELQNRAQKINESSIKLNTQIENSQNNLNKIRDVLQKKYGTSDLNALKELAKRWQEEDESVVSKLEQDVKSKESELLEKQNLIKQIQNY